MTVINHAMLSPAGQPVPLPHEKFLLATPSVSLSLFPLPSGAPLNAKPTPPDSEITAKGTVHTSNKRVVFVAPSASEVGSSGGGASSVAQGEASIAPGGSVKAPLRSLSVPLNKLVDGRLVQPWFSATYYEALCLPTPAGNLAEPHLLRLYFKESGGFDFQQTVQEMRERLEVSRRGGREEVESLPAYEPPAPSSSSSSSSSSSAAQPPSSFLPFGAAAPNPLPSPSPSLLLAAQAARTAEAEEAQRVEQEGRGREGEAGGRREGQEEVGEGEAPPGYEA
ncbi:hypothetical protein JCM8547_004303 [Rhodosporidiobolus lusitaniae]